MQATVATYDTDARSGTVVTDEGRTLEFTGSTLADHIRHLRPGQRVHVGMDGSQITDVHIWR